MEKMGKTVAVITGASSGMGADFARIIAQGTAGNAVDSVDEIWLIARRRDRLEALEKELGRDARVLPLDLSVGGDIERYAQLLRDEKPRVRVLVNAAGYGKFAKAEDTPLDASLGMIDLNARALTEITLRTLPCMDAGAAVINLGSLSSFQPVPYMAVYGSSKAYVLSFSRALNVELKPRGIRVIAVCPGWVRTDFLDLAPTDPKAVIYFDKMWESRDVAVKAFADLAKGRDVSVLGLSVRLQVLLTKLLPHRLVMSIWMKQQKHA